MARPARVSSPLCNKRGACELWIKEGKGAIRWTRPSWPFASTEVAIPKVLFADTLRLISELRPLPVTFTAKDVRVSRVRSNSQQRSALTTKIRRFFAPDGLLTRSDLVNSCRDGFGLSLPLE